MADIKLKKNIGSVTAVEVLDALGTYHYGNDFDGASSDFGPDLDNAVIHLIGSPDEAKANDMLAQVALPTCTVDGLSVTLNCGTLVVDDVTTVTADAEEDKQIRMVLGLNDNNGRIVVFALEKFAEGTFPDLPNERTFVTRICDFSLVANGTELVLIKDYIS